MSDLVKSIRKKPVSTKQNVTNGSDNVALYPKLKESLTQQNLTNIAAQDSRLAKAVQGSGTTNTNFSIGKGTLAEADRLGKIWVGDGAKPVTGQAKCPGCLISSDGARLYRPLAKKDSPFATTG